MKDSAFQWHEGLPTEEGLYAVLFYIKGCHPNNLSEGFARYRNGQLNVRDIDKQGTTYYITRSLSDDEIIIRYYIKLPAMP